MSKVKIVCAAALLVLIAGVSQQQRPEPISEPEVQRVAFPKPSIPGPLAAPSPSTAAAPSPSTAAAVSAYAEQEEDRVVTYNIDLSEDLQLYTYEKCKEYGVDTYFPLILAVMWTESSFKPSVVSKTNDYGLMQINKINHAWLAEELGITDFLDPEQNITAGVRILSEYLLKYENVERALMSYNMGEGGARKHWNKGTQSTNYTRAVNDKLTLILTGGSTEK